MEREKRFNKRPGTNEESVFSRALKAGKKRTYFFDVKATRASDYYLTITESKKRLDGEGYEKHKLHLYREDFNKFVETMQEVIDYIKTELMPDYDFDEFDRRERIYQNTEEQPDGKQQLPTANIDPADDLPENTNSDSPNDEPYYQPDNDDTDLKWD
ncbi:MAG TPA: DUF3276 family protein [Chitinophagales bacterium]|nr:DUF3276 family protein [Chitinophagales bacterium]HRK27450.1 DUF3276 family protein [Chitinophagales bacterium]